MHAVLWIVVGAAVFAGFVVVHELGHALAARLIGVPADEVAVRLAEWPAHVALRANGRWHRPGTTDYQEAYARHDVDLRWLGVFIAAGFVTQTVAMALMVAGSLWLGAHDFGARLVRISIVINGMYLLGDAVASFAVRSPAGDMSSLLRHARSFGLFTVGLVAIAHAAAWYAV